MVHSRSIFPSRRNIEGGYRAACRPWIRSDRHFGSSYSPPHPAHLAVGHPRGVGQRSGLPRLLKCLDRNFKPQVLQLPLAAAAVCTFLIQGSPLNLPLGAALALGLVPGVLMGAALAHSLPVVRLRLGMATVLIVAASLLLAKLIYAQVIGYPTNLPSQNNTTENTQQ